MREQTKLYRIHYTHFGYYTCTEEYMIVEANSMASAERKFYTRKRPIMRAGNDTGYCLEHIEEMAE